MEVADQDLGGLQTAGSRRREVAGGSARRYLLTVLGEFVYPRGEPVWTATLTAALETLGIEEKSARQAIARSSAEGLLFSERKGRRVRWHVTDPGTRLLAEGTDRIYKFFDRPAAMGWAVACVVGGDSRDSASAPAQVADSSDVARNGFAKPGDMDPLGRIPGIGGRRRHRRTWT